MEVSIAHLASVATGVAVDRDGATARAVMVGDLDGSGRLGGKLSLVAPPKAGDSAGLRVADVVISMRGNSNFAAVIDADDLAQSALFATLDLAFIRLFEPEVINPHYLATWLNLPGTQQILAGEREGSGAKRLPIGAVKGLMLPIPAYQRQLAIVGLARAAAEQRELARRITGLRANLINELLRQAATEGPALEIAT